jgi:hypothetical protein
MKKIIVLLLSTFIACGAVADDHAKSKSEKGYEMGRHFLLDAQDCKDTKDGVGRMLFMADELFDQIKAHGGDKSKKWNKEKWGKAAFFSELAADYSTVYQVWCKRRPHKPMAKN